MKQTNLALSVLQPWAWLIVSGRKTVEILNWATKYRGPLLIHASWHIPTGEIREAIEKEYEVRIPDARMVCGGIVGSVELVDCVNQHPWKWSCGPFGFAFAKPCLLPFNRMQGKLRLFNVEV